MTIQGVDISVWQGVIDWGILASRARFCFIRAAYGDRLDNRFRLNWANSRGKLPRGAYLYYLPDQDGVTQALALLMPMNGDAGELPVAIDLEQDSAAPWTLDQVQSLKECIRTLKASTGRQPLIYTSAGWFDPHLGSATFGCDLWVAHWTDAATPLLPAAWTSYRFWQFSNAGRGTDYGASSGAIDLDRFNGDEAAFAELTHPKERVV